MPLHDFEQGLQRPQLLHPVREEKDFESENGILKGKIFYF
jgi:hypothetical protein